MSVFLLLLLLPTVSFLLLLLLLLLPTVSFLLLLSVLHVLL